MTKRQPRSPARAAQSAVAAAPIAIEGREHEVEALIHGDHGDPFNLLGMHADGPQGALTVRAFLPEATQVSVIDSVHGKLLANLGRVHPNGLWAATLGRRKQPCQYRLRVTTAAGVAEFEDAYRFGPVLGELDVHLLAEGTHLRNFERLGAHLSRMDGVRGTAFAVWAPNARRVSVVGDFCDWDGRRLPMRRRHECGVWELFVPHVDSGALYKYEIKGPDGTLLPLKSDPYAFYAERPPHTASVVFPLENLSWEDSGWMSGRAAANALDAPISIYEVHLGSWRRAGTDGQTYLSYAELADTLIPYVKEMGFTHLELMPVSEYPFDGSWGYQPIGLYAPTSRFGTPDAFARFVDRCHREGIGVLLDWVPGHFPTDPHGLGYFDGTHLYEHADPRQGFQPDWNTLIFNYARREVRNYLLGNALFWCERFHADGLRVDAVASMLYLDYSRNADQWVPNELGGRENLAAVALLREMNEQIFGTCPGATTIAEESTAWPGVSRPTYLGGLGFGYKWNMGWMHDTLDYMAQDPMHRHWHHDRLTFGLVYAFGENFILPLSHDEMVHGKKSLIDKMPGDRWQRFANLRAYFGFMFGHPGKKLLFMGSEFAQAREWNHDRSLDWHLLNDPAHLGVQKLVRDLNHLYRETPALHQLDFEPAGFEWIQGGDAEHSVIAFMRQGRAPQRPMLIVCNFTPVPRHGYRLGVPDAGFWHERINTDSRHYGGSGMGNAGGVWTSDEGWHGQTYSLTLTLPPLATLFLEPQPEA